MELNKEVPLSNGAATPYLLNGLAALMSARHLNLKHLHA
jgi:hypothetical protein